MRSKQAFRNVFSSIMLQFIIAITGIYIPQLMIATYGSTVNGMVTSVSQFITYLGLVEAGIGNASTVALYKPLADHDISGINRVMTAARNFYRKSGCIFAVLLAVLAYFYPVFAEEGMEISMIRGMVIILGSSALVDYLFLGKYRILLTANQRGYIVTVTQSVGTILNSFICIVLIKLRCSILLVKATATFVYILRSVYIYFYVKKNYVYLSYKETPNNDALKQRWDVLIHQITGVIVSSTDVVVLTNMLKNFAEISVYTVYNLIASNIISLIDSFSSGLCAGFGEAFAKGETEVVRRRYSTYEYLYYIVIFTGCTCMGILLIPFMKVYTANISDVNYIRPITAILFVLITICRGIRTPALTMVMAVGHYTQTRRAAIIEAVINISFSLFLVNKLGINGVLIGTVCSYLYRTVDMIIYTDRNIICGIAKDSFIRIGRNVIIMCLFILLAGRMTMDVVSWLEWFIYAIGTLSITGIVFLGVNVFFEAEELRNMLSLIRKVVR